MRLLLVGAPDHRVRFRSEIDHTSLSIVGEFATLAEARASGIEADGIVVADPQRRRPSYLDGQELSDEDVLEERLTAREIEVVELLAQGLAEQGNRRAARHQRPDSEIPRCRDLRRAGRRQSDRCRAARRPPRTRFAVARESRPFSLRIGPRASAAASQAEAAAVACSCAITPAASNRIQCCTMRPPSMR